jgi:hypothetical protein
MFVSGREGMRWRTKGRFMAGTKELILQGMTTIDIRCHEGAGF